MQAFWFCTIAVLWAGFFLLEGFDFGVGILLPFVAKKEVDRKVALRTIGPFWDGNEVWLLTAGGATFAAFPEWYATVFSGFYLAFAALLAGLILRGIGVEYRTKVLTAKARAWCDGATVVGSFLPALLLGVAFANFARGVPMDAAHNMTGSFFALLNPYALLGGLVTLGLFTLHGAAFLTIRAEGDVNTAAHGIVKLLSPIVVVLGLVFVVWTTQIRGGFLSVLLAIVIALALVAVTVAGRTKRDVVGFSATSLATGLIPIWAFAVLWPNVLPDNKNIANSLTIYNASSSHYTLTVMTVVALIFTPVVLIYQGWTYWVFRARVTGQNVGDGYGGVSKLVAAARKSAQLTIGHGDDGKVPGTSSTSAQ